MEGVGKTHFSILSCILICLVLTTPFIRPVTSSSINVQQAKDSYELDDTLDTATVIEPGMNQTHSIYPQFDLDYVRIAITTALNLTISINTTQELFVVGHGDLQGFFEDITVHSVSFHMYLLPSNQSYLSFSSNQIIIDSYTLSIKGEPQQDLGNHDVNSTLPLDFDQSFCSVLNYTGSFEQDWYSFTIPKTMSIRVLMSFGNMYFYSLFDDIHAQIFDKDMNMLEQNHYFPFQLGTSPESILTTLAPGNYTLMITYNSTDVTLQPYDRLQPIPYNLTLTSNIEEVDFEYHYPMNYYYSPSEQDTTLYGEIAHIFEGTLPANSTRTIVLSDWPLGIFHTLLLNYAGNISYSILGTNIINATSSITDFINASSITIELKSINGAVDYDFDIFQESPDYFNYHSSEQNPFNIASYDPWISLDRGDITLNYPGAVDWWQYNNSKEGKVTVTFTSNAALNITVYDEYMNPYTPQTSSKGNETTFDFGTLDSIITFRVSFLHPEDWFAQYNITTTFLLVLNTNSASSTKGNTSPLTNYLLEIGGIFVVGIFLMMILQAKLKNRPKDILK